MNIPEDIVEKAARAVTFAQWSMYEPVTTEERHIARAALSAAAPTLMAMALREAADDAFKDKSVQGLARVTIGNWLRARADKEAL